MKFYIGLGGIGCSTLQQFALNTSSDVDREFYFVDSDAATQSSLGTNVNLYTVPDLFCGIGMMRCIGRNVINYEILTGRMDSFFSKLKEADKVELIFVTSSFGGFGSAGIFPLMQYLEAITWSKLVSCEVIAFNERAHLQLGWFPSEVTQKFESNTIEFVKELSAYDQPTDFYILNKQNLFNPGCTSFLINTSTIAMDEFWKYIDAAREDLIDLDCRSQYLISAKEPMVFISYSSKDQHIADMLVSELSSLDISSWIASKDMKEGPYASQITNAISDAAVFLVLISKNSVNSEHVKNEIDLAFNRLKDGITIIPFVIDDTELDAELKYYLCRQQMIRGTEPPIHERIRELAETINGTIPRS